MKAQRKQPLLTKLTVEGRHKGGVGDKFRQPDVEGLNDKPKMKKEGARLKGRQEGRAK